MTVTNKLIRQLPVISGTGLEPATQGWKCIAVRAFMSISLAEKTQTITEKMVRKPCGYFTGSYLIAAAAQALHFSTSASSGVR